MVQKGIIMDLQSLESLVALLKSMAHPTRLETLQLLKERDHTAGELTRKTGTTNANLSRHLSILRQQGLIRTRREANFMHSSLDEQRITEFFDMLHALLQPQQPPKIKREHSNHADW